MRNLGRSLLEATLFTALLVGYALVVAVALAVEKKK